MSRKNKSGSRAVVHATITKRSEAPKLTVEAAESLTKEVTQKDAQERAANVWGNARRRDYADKSDYKRTAPAPRVSSKVEEPAKYLAPPKLSPLSRPIPHDEPDFSVTAIGILLTGAMILGIGIGKLL